MGKLSSRDRKLAHADGQNVSNVENVQFSTISTSASQLILQGPLPVVPTTGVTAVADTVYAAYIGYTQKSLAIDYLQFIQTGSAAAGAQVAEVAIASSVAAPLQTGVPTLATKDLTVLAVNAFTTPDLTAGTLTNGLVRQVAVSYTVSPCTHLWAVCRFDMATTQPTLLGVNLDLSTGFIGTMASHTAVLAAGETLTITAPAQSIAATPAQGPLLRLIAAA